MHEHAHTQIRGERQREEKEMCCMWCSWSHNIVNMHAYMWKGDHPSGISWDTGHVLVCARVRERDNHDKASSLHVKLAGEGARSRAAWYNRGEACCYEWVSRGCVYQWGVGVPERGGRGRKGMGEGVTGREMITDLSRWVSISQLVAGGADI